MAAHIFHNFVLHWIAKLVGQLGVHQVACEVQRRGDIFERPEDVFVKSIAFSTAFIRSKGHEEGRDSASSAGRKLGLNRNGISFEVPGGEVNSKECQGQLF